MAEPTDEELMLRYAAGDAGAFETLYRRHRGPLYRFVLRQAADAGAAEELFQEIWMRVIDSRARYEVRAKFTTWLYTIAHNRVTDHRRATRPAVSLSQEEGEEVLAGLSGGAPAMEAGLDDKRAVARVLEALAELPEAQREAFLMQQEGGMSLEEIAQATGARRETVKSRLRYALAKLRKRLGKPK